GRARVVRLPAPQSTPRACARSAHPDLEAELRAAAHRCALAFARGTPLRAMLVAAPRLGPYVPFLSPAFAAEGIPLRARAETPIAHEPRGALALHAVRLLFDGAPARSYLALAGSDLRRTPLPPNEHEALERLARQLGLSGCDALPERIVEALADEAPVAADAVRRLAARARAAGEARTAAARAAALGVLLDEELAPATPGSRDAEAAAFLAQALRELEHAADAQLLHHAVDPLPGPGPPAGP